MSSLSLTLTKQDKPVMSPGGWLATREGHTTNVCSFHETANKQSIGQLCALQQGRTLASSRCPGPRGLTITHPVPETEA